MDIPVIYLPRLVLNDLVTSGHKMRREREARAMQGRPV